MLITHRRPRDLIISVHYSFKFVFCVLRFNYKTDLIHNLTGSARIIHVFNHTLMKGKTGAVKTVHLPPLEGQFMFLYEHVRGCKGNLVRIPLNIQATSAKIKFPEHSALHVNILNNFF